MRDASRQSNRIAANRRPPTRRRLGTWSKSHLSLPPMPSIPPLSTATPVRCAARVACESPLAWRRNALTEATTDIRPAEAHTQPAFRQAPSESGIALAWNTWA